TPPSPGGEVLPGINPVTHRASSKSERGPILAPRRKVIWGRQVRPRPLRHHLEGRCQGLSSGAYWPVSASGRGRSPTAPVSRLALRADSLGSAGEPLRPGRRPPRAGGGARGRGSEAESPRPAQWPGPAAPLRLLLLPSVRAPPVSPSFLRRLLASRYGAAPPARQHHLRIPEVAPAMEDDQELERKAIEELLKEAKRGKTRAETMGPMGWMKCPLAGTNKRFLINTIKNTLPSQKEQDHEQKEGSEEPAKSQDQKEESRQKHRTHPYKHRVHARGPARHSPPGKRRSPEKSQKRSSKR
uniref:RNA polymerase I and III subunit D n=1 Tax=Phocoena sinus TaxID=42100 RepID=A0A8C9BX77_PHOSS